MSLFCKAAEYALTLHLAGYTYIVDVVDYFRVRGVVEGFPIDLQDLIRHLQLSLVSRGPWNRNMINLFGPWTYKMISRISSATSNSVLSAEDPDQQYH